MIKGFARDGDLDGAQTFLRRMEAAGFRSDYSIFNVLIEAAAIRSRFDVADMAFNQMLAEGLTPSSYTLMILIKRHGREGNVQKAGELLHTLPEKYGFKVSVCSDASPPGLRVAPTNAATVASLSPFSARLIW